MHFNMHYHETKIVIALSLTRHDRRSALSQSSISKTSASLNNISQSPVVHPLVLLSVADHHARTLSRSSSKRVVGVLLGQDNGKVVNVANSFAVPFEEDENNSKTWFLDHNYIESMWEMFKKVNGELEFILKFAGNYATRVKLNSYVFLLDSARTDDWVVPLRSEATSVGS